MRLLCLRSAALVAAVAVAGCGGGGDGDGAGAGKDAPTKAKFVAAADLICIERDKRSAALARATTVTSDADVARLSGELADIYADALAKLRALTLPQGADRSGAEKYARSVAALQPPVRRMKASADALAAAVATKRTAAVEKAGKELQINVNTVQAINDVADQNARSYGLRSCGQQQQAAPPIL